MLGSQFSVVLTSNGSMNTYSDNKLNNFTVNLPQSLNLNGNYEVSLESISFPRNWNNVSEHKLKLYLMESSQKGDNAAAGIVIPGVHGKTKSFTPGYYSTPNELVEEFSRIIPRSFFNLTYGKKENAMLFQIMPDSLLYEWTPDGYLRVTDLMGIPNCIGLSHDAYIFKDRNNKTISQQVVAVSNDSLFKHMQVDMNLGCSHLIILLDIVRETIFSDNLIPVIGVVPITKPRDLQIHSYEATATPSYKEITRAHVTSIKVTLLNDFLAPFPFGDTGRVIITLKFRKIK